MYRARNSSELFGQAHDNRVDHPVTIDELNCPRRWVP